MFHKLTVIALGVGLCAMPLYTLAQSGSVLSGEINISETPAEVEKDVVVAGGEKLVNLSLRNVSVNDLLRALGRQGGFNVAIGESVEGTLSVDLNGVTINEALEAIRTKHNLSYSTPSKNTLMVSSNDSEQGQQLQRTHSDIIPLKYANASVMAQILNRSVFAPDNQSQVRGNTGGQAFMTITPDFRTNSLIVVGNPSDILTAHEYVKVLDVSREQKTWRLSHADAVDVAGLLSSSLFNEGYPTFQFQSSGGSGGSGGAGGGGMSTGMQTLGSLPSSIRVNSEKVVEGEGTTTSSNVVGGGSSGGDSSSDSSESSSGSGGGGVTNNITVRNMQKETELLNITPNGAIIMPDSRLNTVTLFGTAQQIELAEKLIATLDRRAPQVVIEAMLVEVNETAFKDLSFNTATDSRKFGNSYNNTQTGSVGGDLPFTQNIGVASAATEPLRSLFRFTSNQATTAYGDFYYQVNALVSNRRAKILSNPTVVTMHDKEAVISIVDEVIQSVTVTTTGAGANAFTGEETQIGEVGLSMSILPKIAPNGNISLRIRPTLSSIMSTQTDVRGNTITLLTKREALAQQTVLKDGESYVLAGLINDTDTNTANKYPLLGDLPIVGALFRSSVKNKDHSELVVVITPHIINDNYKASADNEEQAPINFQAVANDGSKSILPATRPVTALTNPHKALAHPGYQAGSRYQQQPYSQSSAPTIIRQQVATPPKLPHSLDARPYLTQQQPSAAQNDAPQIRQKVQSSSSTRRPPDPSDLDTSDAAIQAIINKFAPQFDPARDSY